MSKLSVDSLSISKIGELLIEQLGEDAADYTFPEDFEKAVVDIGFNGLVFSGDSGLYDLIVIGNGLNRMWQNTNLNNTPEHTCKTVRFIGESQSIPTYAFYGHTYLESITIPSTIKFIGSNSFRNCRALSNFVFPEGLQTINSGAFLGTSLSSVTLPESMTVLGSQYNGGQFSEMPNLESFVAPSLVSLNSSTNDTGVFAYNPALKTVSLPSIQNIYSASSRASNGAFYGCISLETVNLGSINNPVTSVHNYTFSGCTNASLIITVFTASQYVDTLVTNIRNGATNATIIMKAASDIVYNGTTYQAGDTILTSTPA